MVVPANGTRSTWSDAVVWSGCVEKKRSSGVSSQRTRDLTIALDGPHIGVESRTPSGNAANTSLATSGTTNTFRSMSRVARGSPT